MGRSFSERSRIPNRGIGRSIGGTAIGRAAQSSSSTATGRPASARSSDVLDASFLVQAARRARGSAAGQAAHQTDSNAPICTHFLQGRCKYGDKCTKKHLDSAEARQRALQIGGGAQGIALAQSISSAPAVPSGVLNSLGAQPCPSQAVAGVAGRRGYYEIIGKRLRGVVKSFSAPNGYGFIACPESFELFARDVYATRDQIGSLFQGQEVTFEVILGEMGHPQARNVIPERPFHGYIKSFNEKNGYGFISCVETFKAYGCDVYVHRAQLGDLQAGHEVAFSMVVNERQQPQAKYLMAESNGSFQVAQALEVAQAREAASASAAGLACTTKGDDPASETKGGDLYDPFAAPSRSDDVYDPFAAPEVEVPARTSPRVADVAGVGMPSNSLDNLSKLSVKELKLKLADAGTQVPQGLTEKSDLVALVASLSPQLSS